MKFRRFWTTLLGLVSILWVVTVLSAAPSTPEQSMTPLERARLATVRLITGELDGSGQFHGQVAGSGVVISGNGLVLTSHHIVFRRGGPQFPELWAGVVDARTGYLPPNRAIKLKLIAADESRDLALLQLQPKSVPRNGFTFLRLSEEPFPYLGAPVTLVGFPSDDSASMAIRTDVVGWDEGQGWLKVDVSTAAANLAGGAAINSDGELIGLPTRVEEGQAIVFFGDDDVPVGTLNRGSVGLVRSIDSIRQFLAGQTTSMGGFALPSPSFVPVQIKGNVREVGSHHPIFGAAIGVIIADAQTPETHITHSELLATACSTDSGEFVLNRRLRPGHYQIKIVHSAYKTVISDLIVDAKTNDFQVEMTRER